MPNTSEIDHNQLLLGRFPNLGNDDVIIPGTGISPSTSSYPQQLILRVLVSNIGRAIVKKLAVKFEGNETLGVDDFDMFACNQNLWKTESEKWNAVRQGIIHSSGCTENCMKLQINTLDKNTSTKQNVVIANTCMNKFVIPLDFEMLDSMIPYYQSGLQNRLCYKITFSN